MPNPACAKLMASPQLHCLNPLHVFVFCSVGAPHARQSSTKGERHAGLATSNVPGVLAGRTALATTEVEAEPWWEVDVASAASGTEPGPGPVVVAVWQGIANQSPLAVTVVYGDGTTQPATAVPSSSSAEHGLTVFEVPSARPSALARVRVGLGPTTQDVGQLRLARVQVLVAAHDPAGYASM
jgi:hypothetical protein